MNTASDSQITVIISTRNRGESIVKTIQSILRSDLPDFDLRIVDQTANDRTELAVKPLLDDARIHYVRIPGQGVSAGRNLAICGARTDIIASTDDDCELPPHWLREMRDAFALDPSIGIVFGNVLSSPHDPRAGFVMAYVRKDPFLAKGIREKYKVEGVAACMGLRKSVWQHLGGFDEMLGGGAPFRSAEETDFAVRALLAGYYIYETPKIAVVHHGFHPWEQSRPLFSGYLYGIGAMLAKNSRCGHRWPIAQILFHLAVRWAFHGPVVEFGCIPPRGLRLVAFLKGLRDGTMAPIDRATGHFIKTSEPAGRGSSIETSTARTS
jgi:GT2 family glycosyltransferase